MHKLTEQQQREKKVQKVAVDIAMGQAPVVVVVVIEAVRAWLSETMIRRRGDMEPADADAAAAEAPAAEMEAREEMTDARRSRLRGARRKARAAVAEAAGASEAADGGMLETRNTRKVRPLWLP